MRRWTRRTGDAMTLVVGELLAKLGIDDAPLISGLKASGRKAEAEAAKIGKAAGGELTSETGKETERGGGKIADAMGKIGPTLITGVAAVGALAGAALVKGMADSMDQEAAADKLGAQLGATGEMSEEYGRIAGRVWADGFGESTADVTAMLKELFQNGIASEDMGEAELEALTKQAMTFADVLDQDVNMSGQAVAAMLRNGLAKDATEAFDILARGAQQGVDKSGDLLETFQEYSPLFARLGLDGAAATGLLSQGLKAGARDADFVADALKEFQIRATDGSTASAAGFEALGLSASKMTAQIAKGGPDAAAGLTEVLNRLRSIEDPVKRNTAAVALFGTKAEDLGDSLFALDPSTAVAGLGDVAGATDKLGSAYDNNKSKIESFKRQGLQALTDFVGGTVIPMVEKFAKSKGVQEFADSARVAWDRFGDGMRVVGEWVAATLWPALQQVGAWMVETFGPAVTALAGVWADVLWPALQKVWEIIQDYVWPAWLKIAEVIVTVVIPAVAMIVAKFFEAASWIGTKIGEIVGFVVSLPGRIRDTIVNLWNGLRDGITGARDWVTGKLGDVVDTVTGLPGRISSAASGMWDGIKNAFKSAMNWVIDKWNGLQFTLPSMDLGPLGKVGGWTVGVPDIPKFHGGGRMPGGMGREGLALLQGGEVVLTDRHQQALTEALGFMGAAASGALAGVAEGYSAPVVPITSAPSLRDSGRGGDTIVHVASTADPHQIAAAVHWARKTAGV